MASFKDPSIPTIITILAYCLFLVIAGVSLYQNAYPVGDKLYNGDKPQVQEIGDPYSYGYMPHYVSFTFHPNMTGETVIIKTDNQPAEIGITDKNSQVTFEMLTVYKYTLSIRNYTLKIYPSDTAYEVWTGEKP